MRAPSLSLVLAAALPLGACGSVSSFPDAAGGIDAVSGDASADASTRGTVKVTVIDPASGTPAVGAQVVFYDPDGSVVSRMATNGVGKAQGEVLPGGRVVSVIIAPNQYQMQLVEAVKPGDDFVMNYFDTNGPSIDAGTFGATWSAYNGAAGYMLFGPCGSAGGSASNPLTATMTMYSDCKQNTMDLIVGAYDQSGTFLAFIEKPNVSFTANGSTAMGNGWQSMKTFNAAYTNLPAEVTSVRLNHNVPDGSGWNAQINGVPSGTSLALSVQTVTAATAMVRTDFNNANNSRQQVQAGIAGNVQSYNLDVGGSLLQWIDIPSFTPDTGALAVSLSGASTIVPDGGFTQLSYSRPAALSAVPGVAFNQYSWVIIRPTLGPLTLPTLPAEVGDVGPKAGDSTGVVFAAMVEADAVADYDAFRAGLGNLDAVFGDHVTTGVVRVSTSPNLR